MKTQQSIGGVGATTQHSRMFQGAHVPFPSFTGERVYMRAFTQAREELLLLASDALGCAGYIGQYEGRPAAGGDCSHIETDGLVRVDMEPYRAWGGPTLSMLHEALPVGRDCLRTVVRLNVLDARQQFLR